MRAVAVAFAPAIALAGCTITATFTCEVSTQCGGDGVCEPNHLCAFPDPACPSGGRYGDYSGALSGVCVDQEPGMDGAPPDPTSDARIDAGPDDPCLDWTFPPAGIDACTIPPPLGVIALTAGTWTLDGGTGVLTDGSTSVTLGHGMVAGVDVISVDSVEIQIGARLRVKGALPMVLASWSSIQIDAGAVVDASSNDTGRGAGSPGGACLAPSVGEGHTNGDGGSGGAGFGANGGDGGRGDGGNSNNGIGGPGTSLPLIVDAGCDGAPNANGQAGGAGGGGVALVARLDLTLSGTIHAGGQGGRGSSGSSHAGAGGGSGGMIKLEAAMLSITDSALLAANGGQGGGGSRDSSADNGVDGGPNTVPADSSNGANQGGRGGRGGARSSLPGGDAPTAQDGGGGGGGGVGYIVFSGHASQNVSGSAAQSPPGMPF